MSNPVGSSTAGSEPNIGQNRLALVNLLLNVLPALRNLIVQCKQQQTSRPTELLRRNGTKHEEMGRVTAALLIIEQHVRNIQGLTQIDSFGQSLRSLADCVSLFIDYRARAHEAPKVIHFSPLGFIISFQIFGAR